MKGAAFNPVTDETCREAFRQAYAKTRSDYLRYEAAARALAATADDTTERAYFQARAELHATRAATAPR